MNTYKKIAKKILKPLVPQALLNFRSRYIARHLEIIRESNNPKEIFPLIYKRNMWGDHKKNKFFSGPGSHNPATVDPYLKAVEQFLTSIPFLPDVVDLGCGDFNIGRQLRPFCKRYIACDIVPELIRYNQQNFHNLDVDFRCLDMIEEPLPEGDVVFIREVFQHLSNKYIANVLPKLEKFKYFVLTEYYPENDDFTPNQDISTGSSARDVNKSAVVVTTPPFNFKPRAQQQICQVKCWSGNGFLKTIVYEL